MQSRVLITGGTGNLAGHLRKRLLRRGCQIRVMSRSEPQQHEGQDVEWVVGQITSGDGVAEAVRGVDTIVHTASSAVDRSVEIDGGRHLIRAAQSEGLRHLVYISIIGIDEIAFSYYKTKRMAERLVQDSGLDYTIIRATQFHEFVLMIIEGAARLPVILLPRGWTFQPIYAGDVAQLVAEAVGDGPENGMIKLAGPEILTLDRMLETWMNIRGVDKPVLRVPVPGGLSSGFRSGKNTAPEHSVSGVTWAEFLRRRSDQEPSPPQEKASYA